MPTDTRTCTPNIRAPDPGEGKERRHREPGGLWLAARHPPCEQTPFLNAQRCPNAPRLLLPARATPQPDARGLCSRFPGHRQVWKEWGSITKPGHTLRRGSGSRSAAGGMESGIRREKLRWLSPLGTGPSAGLGSAGEGTQAGGEKARARKEIPVSRRRRRRRRRNWHIMISVQFSSPCCRARRP